jgi:transmembrane 9 superfamily protein 2/4
LAGIIPFAIAFLNWHEFLISISKGEYILSIPHTVYVSILLLVSSAQMTIVLVFLQLCSEDYLWWWQAFMIGASPACYLFAYGFFYYWQTSKIEGMVGASIYMVNLMLGCGLLGLCTGTLGFLSTYVVIRRMYSTVKVDSIQ